MSEEVKTEVVEEKPKSTQDEIKDMLAGDISPKVEVKEPEVREPKDKKEEPKAEEKPGEEEKVEEDAVDLINLLNELAGGVPLAKKEEPKEEPKKEEVKTEIKPEPEVKKETLSDKDFEDLFESKEAFLEFLGKRDEKIREEARKGTLQDTQELVSKAVHEQVVRYSAAEKFWEKNADLRPLGSFVAKKANEIAGKNPEMDIHTIFAKTGEEVRRVLDAVKKTVGKDKEVKGKETPKFVKAPSPSGGEEEKLTGTLGEISELIKMTNNT